MRPSDRLHSIVSVVVGGAIIAAVAGTFSLPRLVSLPAPAGQLPPTSGSFIPLLAEPFDRQASGVRKLNPHSKVSVPDESITRTGMADHVGSPSQDLGCFIHE
jgi:hypothetical protein